MMENPASVRALSPDWAMRFLWLFPGFFSVFRFRVSEWLEDGTSYLIVRLRRPRVGPVWAMQGVHFPTKGGIE